MRISDWSSDVCSSDLYGFSGTAELDLGAATLRSITAYRHSDYEVLLDLDQTTAPLSIFTFFERAHQFSEELQLSGEFGESKWMVGCYYFKERIRCGSQHALRGAIFGLPAGYKNGNKVNGVKNTEEAARSEERSVGKKCGRAGD